MARNPDKNLQAAMVAADELVAATAQSTNENVIIGRLSLQQARISTENKRLQRKHDRRLARALETAKKVKAEVQRLTKDLAEAQSTITCLQAELAGRPAKPLSDIDVALAKWEQEKTAKNGGVSEATQ